MPDHDIGLNHLWTHDHSRATREADATDLDTTAAFEHTAHRLAATNNALLKRLVDLNTPPEIYEREINALTVSGNIIDRVPGARIAVVSYVIVVDASVTVQFMSGGASGKVLTGGMAFAANGGLSAPASLRPYFRTNADDPLYLLLSNTTSEVNGHVSYVVEYDDKRHI